MMTRLPVDSALVTVGWGGMSLACWQAASGSRPRTRKHSEWAVFLVQFCTPILAFGLGPGRASQGTTRDAIALDTDPESETFRARPSGCLLLACAPSATDKRGKPSFLCSGACST